MGTFTHWLRSARGKTFVVATMIGLAGLLAGIPLRSRLQRVDLGVFWFELFAAPFILGAVEILIRGVEAWMESKDEKDFRRFFGDGVIAKGTLAVFPTAEPPVLDDGFCHLLYPNPPLTAVEKQARAKGIKHVVPYEDLRAVIALAALFQKMRVSLKMALDSRFDAEWERDHPLIGIGLGFNHVTANIAAMCPELYSITFESGTDDFLFEKRKHGFPKDQRDCALVVRAVGHGGGTPQFICAGRTAAGTQAAGVYLASEWTHLLSLYEKNGRNLGRDSLAVLLSFPERVPDEAVIERTCFSPAPIQVAVVPRPDSVGVVDNDEAEHLAGA